MISFQRHAVVLVSAAFPWSATAREAVVQSRLIEEFDVIAVHQSARRKIALIIAAAVVMAFAVLGSTSPASAAGTGTVSGTITQAGAPLLQTIAFNTVTSSYWVTPGPGGAYSIALEEGAYTVGSADVAGVLGAVTVVAGQNVVWDFDFEWDTVAVSGTVTRDGAPVTSGVVYVSAGPDAYGQWTISGSGAYSGTVMPGQYSVQIHTPNELFRSGGTFTAVTPGGSLVHDVALAALAQVSGQVVSTAGAPVPGVDAITDPWISGESAWAATSDAAGQLEPWFSMDVGQTVVIGVNRQSRQSLYTGRFYAGPGVLGSATQAGALPVTTTATTDLGQIVLDTCGTVSGTVSDMGSWTTPGVDLVEVVVFNDDDADLVSRTAPVAADGSFAVTGLLPGSYYAAAVSLNTGLLEAREFFEGVAPETGTPNVVVNSTCGAVTGVDFGSADQPPTGFTPDENDLVDNLKGKISAPDAATAGSTVTVQVPGHAGESVYAYLFSDPVYLGRHVVSSGGTIAVKLPAGVTGVHRIAVYALSGVLIGWDTITISAASGPGDDGSKAGGSGGKKSGGGSRLPITGAAAGPVLALIAALTAAGCALLVVRRRRHSTV
ncbi:MAG: LPXTG cell wall anchor domain-containing protein [Micrococcales bacterium]|nr:LPXTG cell wall anchor domain-containing protein [Micrococcales bacterium]